MSNIKKLPLPGKLPGKLILLKSGNVKISELEQAEELSNDDLLLLSQEDKGAWNSRRATLKQLFDHTGARVVMVSSGEELDALNADVGVYYFTKGSVIHRAPESGTVPTFPFARLEVFIPGEYLRITTFSTYARVWEFFPGDITGDDGLWCFVGQGTKANATPTASITIG